MRQKRRLYIEKSRTDRLRLILLLVLLFIEYRVVYYLSKQVVAVVVEMYAVVSVQLFFCLAVSGQVAERVYTTEPLGFFHERFHFFYKPTVFVVEFAAFIATGNRHGINIVNFGVGEIGVHLTQQLLHQTFGIRSGVPHIVDIVAT